MTAHPENVEWYCKGCGALNKLDMGTGAMQLAAGGISVKGGLMCDSCMTRHEIEDVVVGKYSNPQQQRDARGPDGEAVNLTTSPAPTRRLLLGAVGLFLMSLETFLFLIWGTFGEEYVPDWFLLQVVDQGLSLVVLRALSLILISLGLMATYNIRPQLWYLAGLVALLLLLQVVVFWLLGDETLFGGASNLSEGLVVWMLYGIRWLPIYPILVLLLAIGAFQLTAEIGTSLSRIIFFSGLLNLFSVAVFTFNIPLSLFTDFPIPQLALAVCYAFSGVALFQLSRR